MTSRIWIFFWGFCWLSCQNNSQDSPSPLLRFPEETSTRFGPPQDQGLVQNDELNEVSGLAVSLSNPNYLWCHNDSGDDARIYLLGQDGRDAGFIYLDSITAIDWEDMAIFQDPGDQKAYIYLADIGDNQAGRSSVQIYRIPEPPLDMVSFPYTDTLNPAQIESYSLSYDNGSRDAEAFMIDQNGDWYILSKSDPSFFIFRVSYPQSPLPASNQALQLGSLPETLVTAADLNPQSGDILIKTYSRVYWWDRSTDNTGSAGDWMLQQGSARLSYTAEAQGEAIAWLPDGSGYYTLSEEALGIPARLFFYEKL